MVWSQLLQLDTNGHKKLPAPGKFLADHVRRILELANRASASRSSRPSAVSDALISLDKNRAVEAIRLLLELNDSIKGHADTRTLDTVLDTDTVWLVSFSIVIALNLDSALLERLSSFLSRPPLVVVCSTGFLAEFFIQFHEHTIAESHSENAPSFPIDKPFPALRDHTQAFDFDAMDPIKHGHIPYVVILVRVLEEWKESHDGQSPKTYTEWRNFKRLILAMKIKAQTLTTPKHKRTVIRPRQSHLSRHEIRHLHLQQLYKTHAEEEKQAFESHRRAPVDDAIVSIVGDGVELPEALDQAIGELLVPSHPLILHLTILPHVTLGHLPAELPNIAAFLGGILAQETIKIDHEINPRQGLLHHRSHRHLDGA
ncbi:hypothetical protein HD554DRAFT_2037120 [Boletus coccyginus]|nr:hypothetical protein HD554DRAFT_2037120 [Boletus coccyginus]